MNIREIYEKNPDLSFESALHTVGSEELLTEVAVQFGEDLEENIDALEAFTFNRDYKNFTIKVHSLKSSARMIGEEKLAGLARDLEKLGKSAEAGDTESQKNIIRLFPETILRYMKTGLSFSFLTQEEKEPEGQEEPPEGYMDSFFEETAALVEGFDSEGLEKLFEKTDGYLISGREAERYRALKKAYRDSDWDRMAELATE